jgi:hemerythrin-like domain-containing protein
MSEMLPTDELREEHKVAVALVRELADAVSRVKGGEACGEREAIEGARERALEVQKVLHLHFGKEEEGLFPDVLVVASRGAPRVDILTQFFSEEADDDLKAHTLLRRRMKDMLSLLEGALQSGRCEEATAARLGTLMGLSKDLLERHATKEHELIFPLIERLLDDAQLAAVRERMRAISRGG